MDAAQRDGAMGIVHAAMSERGAREVADVIALETILGAIEREAGRANWPRRDPELYWFAVFGDPTGATPRGRGGSAATTSRSTSPSRMVAIVGSTPSFLGANPAVVPGGPHRRRRGR